MRLKDQPASKNVVDKTDPHYVLLKGMIDITPEEYHMMKKNNWTPEDVMMMRQAINLGTRMMDSSGDEPIGRGVR